MMKQVLLNIQPLNELKDRQAYSEEIKHFKAHIFLKMQRMQLKREHREGNMSAEPEPLNKIQPVLKDADVMLSSSTPGIYREATEMVQEEEINYFPDD